jgi:hypothetical protein
MFYDERKIIINPRMGTSFSYFRAKNQIRMVGTLKSREE